MKLTQEQEDILEAVNSNNLVKVKSVAGSGKTFILQAIVDHYKPFNGLYLAFNKAIADEAIKKFPSSIECKTIHALAYKYTNYQIGYLNYNTIKEGVSYQQKKLIIDTLESFFNSKSINAQEYLSENLTKDLLDIAINLLNDMYYGKVKASFGFMLKMFHIGLKEGSIEVPNLSLLMLDEAGDTTEVILDIFTTLNAHKKVMVGDPYQNIYVFNDTIDGFNALKDKGITMTLSESFRCTREISDKVQAYCTKYLDKDFKYIGNLDYNIPKNKCYLSRSNATVIRRMISFMQSGTTFNIIRDIKEIFSLPLAIYNIMKGKTAYIDTNRYMYLITAFKTCRGSYLYYLLEHFKHDVQIVGACNLILDLIKKSINLLDVYMKVPGYINPKSNITLATVHSCKGLEWDSVYIENNMNETVSNIIEKGGPKDLEEQAELYLYYVAITRSKYELKNADLCKE